MAAIMESVTKLKYYLASFMYLIFQKKALLLLKKISKTGTMKNVNGSILDAADFQILNAFEPIMNLKGVTQATYLENPEIKREYRDGFVDLISNFTRLRDTYSKVYPNLYSPNGEIRVEELSKLVRTISTEWVELRKNITEKKADETFLRKSSNFSFGSYILTLPQDRKKILQVSNDKNYSRDSEIYKAFAPEIGTVNGLSYDGFIANKELRAKYYNSYLKCKSTMSRQESQELDDKTCLDRIRSSSASWTHLVKQASIAGRETTLRFTTSIPLANYALMTPEQQANLSSSLTNELNKLVAQNESSTSTGAKKM